jgi:hypothetical protein
VLRQQAVIERVCDAKIGERRGNALKMATTLIACSRKFLTAQIPQSPQSDQARPSIFQLHKENPAHDKKSYLLMPFKHMYLPQKSVGQGYNR